MTKGNASTNTQRMGAIRIIFERLATTKRVNARSANSQGHVRRDGTTPDSLRFLRRSVHL